MKVRAARLSAKPEFGVDLGEATVVALPQGANAVGLVAIAQAMPQRQCAVRCGLSRETAPMRRQCRHCWPRAPAPA